MMNVNKHIKGASNKQIELVAPLRAAVIEITEDADDVDLIFIQNELRRLSREIKRSKKKKEKEEAHA